MGEGEREVREELLSLSRFRIRRLGGLPEEPPEGGVAFVSPKEDSGAVVEDDEGGGVEEGFFFKSPLKKCVTKKVAELKGSGGMAAPWKLGFFLMNSISVFEKAWRTSRTFLSSTLADKKEHNLKI